MIFLGPNNFQPLSFTMGRPQHEVMTDPWELVDVAYMNGGCFIVNI